MRADNAWHADRAANQVKHLDWMFDGVHADPPDDIVERVLAQRQMLQNELTPLHIDDWAENAVDAAIGETLDRGARMSPEYRATQPLEPT